MKKLIAITSFALLGLFTYAQAPQKMTYQSVIRNNSNTLISNTSVGIQISILSGSTTGTPVYVERHITTTNINGLATFQIGNGTPVTGTFSGIDWSTGNYYIKTETDPSGGTAYSITGTSQLLSVPYALYAQEAGNGGGGSSFSGNYNDLTNAPTNVSAFTNDAGYITNANDADADPTNEIQSLSISGQSLSISGGNTITLPAASAAVTLDGAYDQGGAGAGRIITADAGPVQINGSGSNTAALGILFTGTGNSINASNTNAANTFAVVQAVTNSSTITNSAVLGQSSGAARALTGEVTAAATADAAVRGNNLRTAGGMGVEGVGFNGVSGQSNYRQGYGVFGQNFDLNGPTTANAVGVGGVGYVGVMGQSNDPTNGFGIASQDNMIALGNLTVSGTKNFRIDHPQDPANKYLNHFSIESNEVLNIYRGTVAFDQNGTAVVQLPGWFDAVNKNASYQLTPIGGYAPIFIAEKIKDGRFVISGGTAGMEVSWAVYAERNDPYLQQHPEAREVEQVKSSRETGKYLRPDLYNKPAEEGILAPMNTEKSLKK
ncbi:hypothetical protein D3C87_197280 [compost metagenome]